MSEDKTAPINQTKPIRVAFQTAGSEDIRLIPLFAGEDGKAAACPELIKASRETDDFSGALSESRICYMDGRRTLLLGLGKAGDLTRKKMMLALGSSAKTARRIKNIKSIGIPLTAVGIIADTLSISPAAASDDIVSAISMALYTYTLYKTKEKQDSSAQIETIVFSGEAAIQQECEVGSARAQSVFRGIALARNLINGPSNDITPIKMASEAARLAEEYQFKLTVFDREEMLAQGMGGICAVSQGSTKNEPRFIVLEYAKEGHSSSSPVVVIGKGVTFDTGGISIKPSSAMADMKTDMSGAAAVLGLFEALGTEQPPCRVIGIAPCSDNMPDGKSYKPGDIIKTLSGQTVEIDNTDAEGRMLLCDALTYAQKNYTPAPAFIIDLATLTGACVVAVGKMAGLFCTDEKLCTDIIEIGKENSEEFWRLPLGDAFFETLKSNVADMKNSGNREAGASQAAMFLKQFVNDGTPWAHLDIAGSADDQKESPLHPGGAIGFGVRTLAALLRKRFQ